MTTLVQRYLDGLYAAIESMPDFPALTERSTLRAFKRDDGPMIVIHLGKEAVLEGPWPRSNRAREVLCTAHTAGEDREDQSEAVFEALQPIVMGFTADNLVQVEEIGTDEPKYAQADLNRMAVTKRFYFTYQTAADSLSA